MEKNQTNQMDLIALDTIEDNSSKPLNFGILSISFLFLSFISSLGILFWLSVLLFIFALLFSIIGLKLAFQFKKRDMAYTNVQLKKILWGKWLSLITLILSSLTIVGLVSLIILIGNQGFGR
jgi:Zn-dependent membrane protease YugP